jgi:hypothetical protein
MASIQKRSKTTSIIWLRRNVSASTQSGTLDAVAFLYHTALLQYIPVLDNLRRTTRNTSIPVLMSTQEVSAALAMMSGTMLLMTEPIYLTGM